ncbi:Cell division control protein 24 [Zancudomyces culisetae]|uniref:Cell division control protein 24 n=1 Tax=Zancudomyces culisetae TaxID=1213189 RepID=A0A1R1PF64_ZANCU|nr:Cell division control protein 24 [Zancudomyces culisetae]|eukprot:OMH79640.1 Cell division control protein 24 [Zancudomyces culisetae]
MNQNSTNLRDVGGGGTVNSNILNRPTPTSSIYQKSLELLDKLAFVPGMEQFYEPLLNQKFDNSEQLYRDPMQFLWSIFQKGISLCILYNALEPLEKLEVEDIEQGGINTRKKAVYSFMKAVRNRQIGNEQDYFTITELFRDDTNSFLKASF